MTPKQEAALREYLQEAIVPLIEQVLVKKLGQAMSFAAEQLIQPKPASKPAIKQDLTPEQPAQQQKEGFASPGGGYVPAIPRPMPLDWKLVPRKATPEMLKAMDECAQEGYDERLYAGMASSVYMAAWDASPVMGTLPEQPAQQEPVAWGVDWGRAGAQPCVSIIKRLPDGGIEVLATEYGPPASKPLTDEEIILIAADCASSHQHTDIHFARAIEAAHGIKGDA